MPGRFVRMAPEAERTLYRVVQESLTNVDRHAAARGVAIRLTEDSHSIRLEIQDDGRGMPPEVRERASPETVSGGGIPGMTEHVRQLAGRVEIHSDRWGTRITAIVPLSHARPDVASRPPSAAT